MDANVVVLSASIGLRFLIPLLSIVVDKLNLAVDKVENLSVRHA